MTPFIYERALLAKLGALYRICAEDFQGRQTSKQNITRSCECIVTLGGTLRWEQQCKFRHMTTRQYLILKDTNITLTDKHDDPKTVFRLHPVIKVYNFSTHLV